ncbi:hypothetical protein [Lewinella cohaerens]|uniref:hypothetical protein n=1 Tax=Lewinella cohaerens TaxID=70995 RepID=UPI00036392AF|nr:hypothetical protein [Lewinella cohaerens]
MIHKMLLGLILPVLFLASCCDDDDNACACPEPLECVEGECVWPSNYVNIGGSGIISDNLYFGVLPDHLCLDTIAFITYPGEERFSMHLNTVPSNVTGVDIVPIEEITPDVWTLGHVEPLCSNDGGWYANIVAELFEPDSVRLKFRFWLNDTPEGEFIDSTTVTLVEPG